jgi:hypothetical protein
MLGRKASDPTVKGLDSGASKEEDTLKKPFRVFIFERPGGSLPGFLFAMHGDKNAKTDL